MKQHDYFPHCVVHSACLHGQSFLARSVHAGTEEEGSLTLRQFGPDDSLHQNSVLLVELKELQAIAQSQSS